jgi:hypothetical protein
MKYKPFNFTNKPPKSYPRLGVVIDGVLQTDTVQIVYVGLQPFNAILAILSNTYRQVGVEFNSTGDDGNGRTLVELPRFEVDGTPVYVGDRLFSVNQSTGEYTMFLVNSITTYSVNFHLSVVMLNGRAIFANTPIWNSADEKALAGDVMGYSGITYLQYFKELNDAGIVESARFSVRPPCVAVQQYQAIFTNKNGDEYLDGTRYSSMEEGNAAVCSHGNAPSFKRCIPTIIKMIESA